MRALPLLFLCIMSCSDDNTQINSAITETPTLLPDSTKATPVSYDKMKTNIQSYRKALDQPSNKNDYKFLEQCFTSVVVDSIISYWYGTEWDFNGTTQTPGKGAIACGYFVSTVLRDAGLSVNRVKTSQASAEIIIRQFAGKNDIKVFHNKSLDTSLAFVKKEGEGLFIVGLDSHVGFLFYDGMNIWFIHSKWVNPKAVVKEEASQSGILYYSKYRVIGKISNNKKLLDDWIHSD